MQPAAAPLVMSMCGYTGGVATIRIYPYPALTVNFHVNFIFMSSVCRATIYVKVVIIKSLIPDGHAVDGEFSGVNVQFPFTGYVTRTGSGTILIVILRFSCCGAWIDKHNTVLTTPSTIFGPSDLFI